MSAFDCRFDQYCVDHKKLLGSGAMDDGVPGVTFAVPSAVTEDQPEAASTLRRQSLGLSDALAGSSLRMIT